jgi:hypothetical protein
VLNIFSLENLLKTSGKRMSADLAERLIPHAGELGADREEIIRQFLRAYLPKRFEISNGFVFDSGGNVSKQLDVIIANSLVSPRFETAGGIRFYPCESVVAVGQVKSSLNSRRLLREAIANLESAKSLDRSAGGKAIDISRKEQIDHFRNHLHQIFTFIFVIGETLEGETIHHELMNHVLAKEPHLWPNVVFALNKYLATFCCDNGICPNPMDARGTALQSASEEDDLLMRFYLLLGGAIEATRVSAFSYWDYLHSARSWSAEVWYSPTDDPPPHLHSLTRAVVEPEEDD